MGDWLFRRSTFGPQSGYAEPWCDLPHWGFVLDGNMVLHWESQDLELLGPGDVYHCPGGPPGHRMEVADGALVVDYTPMSALDDERIRRAARTVRAYVSPATRRRRKPRTAQTGWTTRTSAPSSALEPGTARRSPDVPAGRSPARPVQAHRSRSRTACNRSPPMLSREAPLPRRIAGG